MRWFRSKPNLLKSVKWLVMICLMGNLSSLLVHPCFTILSKNGLHDAKYD